MTHSMNSSDIYFVRFWNRNGKRLSCKGILRTRLGTQRLTLSSNGDSKQPWWMNVAECQVIIIFYFVYYILPAGLFKEEKKLRLCVSLSAPCALTSSTVGHGVLMVTSLGLERRPVLSTAHRRNLHTHTKSIHSNWFNDSNKTFEAPVGMIAYPHLVAKKKITATCGQRHKFMKNLLIVKHFYSYFLLNNLIKSKKLTKYLCAF